MNFYQNWCIRKATIKHQRLKKFYKPTDNILDIGSGNCALNWMLQNDNKAIVALDVVNKSAFKDITPTLYNGKKLPYEDNKFEVVQLITVLHHIKKPEAVLAEAIRVGKKIIIMEDIYDGMLQKYLTFFADSINNLEFIGHPHSNKTDQEWLNLFDKYSLKLHRVEYYNFLFFFKQATYVLVKQNTSMGI